MTETGERKASGHRAEVVGLELRKHEGADTLSVARVHGYDCVLKTDDWAGRPLAVFVPPDTLADVSRPEFAFLAKDARADGKARVRAKKIRGVLSFGLLVPAPEGAAVGDDCWERLGLEHYRPPAAGAGNSKGGALYAGGEAAIPPAIHSVRYDVEAGRRYASEVFTPGEAVFVTEKIHGASARYVFFDGRMHCGSRETWKKECPEYGHVTVEALEPKVGRERAEEVVARLHSLPKKRNMWWQALDATPGLLSFCREHPGVTVYGEVYGAVQDLNYGCVRGEALFAAFDLMRDGNWMDSDLALSLAKDAGLPWVPLLAPDSIPYDFDAVCAMAEGRTTVPGANHVREGCVVKPAKEREHPRLGRACLKWVGCGYLERKESPAAEDAVLEE